ncbi:hypothetical protein ACFLZL_02340 [Thermodesulfobacteriota bacterium]
MSGIFKRIKKIEARLPEALCVDRYTVLHEISGIKKRIKHRHSPGKMADRMQMIEKRLNTYIK